MRKDTPYRSPPASTRFDQQKLVQFVEAQTKVKCTEAGIREDAAKQVRSDHIKDVAFCVGIAWTALVQAFDPDAAHPVPLLAFLVATALGIALGMAWGLGWRRYTLNRLVRVRFESPTDVLTKYWRAEILALEETLIGEGGFWTRLIHLALAASMESEDCQQLTAIKVRHARLLEYLRRVVSELDVTPKEYVNGTGPSEAILLAQLGALTNELALRMSGLRRLEALAKAQLVIHDPSAVQGILAVIETAQAWSALNLPRVEMGEECAVVEASQEVEVEEYRPQLKRTA